MFLDLSTHQQSLLMETHNSWKKIKKISFHRFIYFTRVTLMMFNHWAEFSYGCDACTHFWYTWMHACAPHLFLCCHCHGMHNIISLFLSLTLNPTCRHMQPARHECNTRCISAQAKSRASVLVFVAFCCNERAWSHKRNVINTRALLIINVYSCLCQ
jgi:hypothetical protein